MGTSKTVKDYEERYKLEREEAKNARIKANTAKEEALVLEDTALKEEADVEVLELEKEAISKETIVKETADLINTEILKSAPANVFTEVVQSLEFLNLTGNNIVSFLTVLQPSTKGFESETFICYDWDDNTLKYVSLSSALMKSKIQAVEDTKKQMNKLMFRIKWLKKVDINANKSYNMFEFAHATLTEPQLLTLKNTLDNINLDNV